MTYHTDKSGHWSTKWLLVALLPILLAVVLYYRWPYPGLPEASEVANLKAWLFNTDVPQFTVPPDHVPKILQALQPAEAAERPGHGTMGVGELRLTDRQGTETR